MPPGRKIVMPDAPPAKGVVPEKPANDEVNSAHSDQPRVIEQTSSPKPITDQLGKCQPNRDTGGSKTDPGDPSRLEVSQLYQQRTETRKKWIIGVLGVGFIIVFLFSITEYSVPKAAPSTFSQTQDTPVVQRDRQSTSDMAIALNQAPPNQPPNPMPIQPLQKWSNDVGQVIEASFEGMERSDYVLLKLPNGIVHRYPINRLSPESRQLALNWSAQKILSWNSKNGQMFQASFEGLDGPDYVLFRSTSGTVHKYSLEDLSEESLNQALKLDAVAAQSTQFKVP